MYGGPDLDVERKSGTRSQRSEGIRIQRQLDHSPDVDRRGSFDAGSSWSFGAGSAVLCWVFRNRRGRFGSTRGLFSFLTAGDGSGRVLLGGGGGGGRALLASGA